MSISAAPFDQAHAHRWFAVEANNLAWDLLAVANQHAAGECVARQDISRGLE